MAKKIRHCDVCGRKSPHLSDYYAMLCSSCREHFVDGQGNIALLMRIGQLMTQLEKYEENGNKD
jgi:hypothetical protein